jgi:hypothetical protein
MRKVRRFFCIAFGREWHTAPFSLRCQYLDAVGGEADIARAARTSRFDPNDPLRSCVAEDFRTAN